MVASTDWVVVGRFGRTHGVKGAISVISFTEPRDNIVHYGPWHVPINKQWQPIQIVRTEVNDKAILAWVENYSEREQVSVLTNVEIGVPSEKLPELSPGEYYWHQVIGMQVVNQEGALLGSVTDMMPTGTHDVMVVTGIKRCLIPYLPERVVLNVDSDAKQITVDWSLDYC